MKAANELIEAASMETESGLEDILLVRKLLEGYAAEACAERIEPKELQKLKKICRQTISMQSAMEGREARKIWRSI